MWYCPSMSSAPIPASSAVDPVLAALDRAPAVRRLTPGQRAELDQASEDIAAGRVQLIPNDDVPAWLEAKARELGELTE